MTVDELRTEMASYCSALTEKGKSGHMVRYTVAGPVGMPLIDKLVEVMERSSGRLTISRERSRRVRSKNNFALAPLAPSGRGQGEGN